MCRDSQMELFVFELAAEHESVSLTEAGTPRDIASALRGARLVNSLRDSNREY